mmetsp:Transcript_32952/g.87680  ORF Transcript_32952/g.87680 Transcript_32952/m.87680 type:complete len:216 (+) Transcript_32952:591-1238(+)
MFQGSNIRAKTDLSNRVQGETIHEVEDVLCSIAHRLQHLNHFRTVLLDDPPDVVLKLVCREHLRRGLPLCVPRLAINVEDAVPEEVRHAVAEELALRIVLEVLLQYVLDDRRVDGADRGRLEGDVDVDRIAELLVPIGELAMQPLVAQSLDHFWHYAQQPMAFHVCDVPRFSPSAPSANDLRDCPWAVRASQEEPTMARVVKRPNAAPTRVSLQC